jgi:glycosyltransferase involved in cell wall biosynthesis
MDTKRTAQLADTTVVIPSFLRKNAARLTVESILLTGHPVKFIIVDDSGQHENRVDEEWLSEDSDIRVIRMPFDSGLSSKRNRGVMEAKTKYVLISDDGTTWNRLDLPQLINELKGFDFLAPEEGVKAHLFKDAEGKIFWASGKYWQHQGRPIYHYVWNYMFGERQTFLDNPWSPELHCGEHLPWAYERAFLGDLKITTTSAMSMTNIPIHGDELYKAMRHRAKYYRKDWFARHNLNDPEYVR